MAGFNYKIVGVGEVLWDLLPSGRQMGGAPANFAYHAKSLGTNACVITRVGKDALGDEILQKFKSVGFPLDLVQVDTSYPTGTVSVELMQNGVPNFTIHRPVAWDYLEITEPAINAVKTADAVCFGTLAQRNDVSARSVRKLIDHSQETALKIFDINLRQNFYSKETIEISLKLSNVFKINDSELQTLAAIFELNGNLNQQVETIASRFNIHTIAVTFGEEGSLLFQDGKWSHYKPHPVNVVDTVGAGDAFTAALAIGLLRKFSLDKINYIANEVAAYVCSQPGATPALPESLRELFFQ
ncbi:MAG: carbohydrate kinase [Verrucomicrobiae bacterium]|nr:carbohydrate kinase [Verrucomicrobiae bacterium]